MNKYILMVLVFFGLVLSGCGNGGDTRQSDLLDFGGGSSSGNGVSFEFTEATNNIQPQKGQPFSMIVDLKNYQRHEVSDLVIKVSGFDVNYVNSDLEKSEVLSAATDNGPTQKALIYKDIVLDGFEDDYNWNPVFRYCYSAKTQFREQVCVPNSFNQLCENSIDTSTFSNGPLGVRIVTIYPIGENEIGIDFEVSDVLNGDIVNECFEDRNLNPFGAIDSGSLEVTLGSTSGVCKSTSSDDYTVINDNLKFSCTFARDSGNSDPYATQVKVVMDYEYQQEVKKNIVVKDLEQFRR